MSPDSAESEYEKMLSIREEAVAAQRKATEAELPWRELAWQIAKETKGLLGSGEVRFEKTRFRIACQGTGIYQHEGWWESFPIELLLNRMRESSERR